MYCVAYTRGDAESRHVKDGGTVVERDARHRRPPPGSLYGRAVRKRPQPAPGGLLMEIGAIDAETLAERQRLARSRPRSGRASVAKASAIRTLERLARGGTRVASLPCPSGWHPSPGSAWEELDHVYLAEHPEVRQRMWEQSQGY
jgi:hypothetical protein